MPNSERRGREWDPTTPSKRRVTDSYSSKEAFRGPHSLAIRHIFPGPQPREAGRRTSQHEAVAAFAGDSVLPSAGLSPPLGHSQTGTGTRCSRSVFIRAVFLAPAGLVGDHAGPASESPSGGLLARRLHLFLPWIHSSIESPRMVPGALLCWQGVNPDIQTLNFQVHY